jgi:cationic amino acid transporter 14
MVITIAIFFLYFRSLSQIFPLTGTPVVATVLSGVASAVAALVINLDTLIEMMSIGKYLG